MARNYEKNFGRLNRLWLEKGKASREKRPKLSSLKTADDIAHWLPSIKGELDFYLKQSEVPCYTEVKIEECCKHIMHLEAEYKAFVRKLHQLDSRRITTPWTPRPYEKRTGNKHHLELHPMDKRSQLVHFSPIETPILMNDHRYQDVNDDEMWSPAAVSSEPQFDRHPNQDDALQFEFDKAIVASTTSSQRDTSIQSGSKKRHLPTFAGEILQSPEVSVPAETQTLHSNILGLDYSSSSDDEV